MEVDEQYAGYATVPDRVMNFRVADLTAAVRGRPGVRSVALPSFDNGVISGDALLARLSEAAREGWEPSPLDLEQSLLRLDLAELAPEPFEALETSAGRQAAAWITGGGPTRPASVQCVPLSGITRESPSAGTTTSRRRHPTSGSRRSSRAIDRSLGLPARCGVSSTRGPPTPAACR